MKKLAVLKILMVIVLLVVPVMVMAQGPSLDLLPADPGLPGDRNADLRGTIMVIIQQWLLPFAGIIAVLFIIIGGFQFMLAGANPDLAKKGRETLKNAVVGLVVVILSYAIITIVVNTLFRIR